MSIVLPPSNKIENRGETSRGKLTAKEWNDLVKAVELLTSQPSGGGGSGVTSDAEARVAALEQFVEDAKNTHVLHDVEEIENGIEEGASSDFLDSIIKANGQSVSQILDLLNQMQKEERARILAEVLRVSKENERISNEVNRVYEEDVRIVSEKTRVNNENTRQTNEGVRVTNEARRVENEVARVANEEKRESAEGERSSLFLQNERNRANTFATNESNRNTTFSNNEQNRQSVFENNEAQRSQDLSHLDEFIRHAEATHVLHDYDVIENIIEGFDSDWREHFATASNQSISQLVSELDSIQDAEKKRLVAEALRAAAEIVRENAQKTFTQSETNREERENVRIANERKRNEDETARNDNEDIRVANEVERVASELERKANEVLRQTKEQERNNAFQTQERLRQDLFEQNELKRQTDFEENESMRTQDLSGMVQRVEDYETTISDMKETKLDKSAFDSYKESKEQEFSAYKDSASKALQAHKESSETKLSEIDEQMMVLNTSKIGFDKVDNILNII